MKIDLNSPAVNLVPASAGTKKVSTAGTTSAQGGTVDRTTFQTDSQSVQSLTSQAMQTPEIRQDKVDALSNAVRSGEYKADASKTASAIASQG